MSTHPAPIDRPNLMVTQMALVKWVTTQTEGGILGKGLVGWQW